MSERLVDYELQVLRSVSGEDVPGVRSDGAFWETVEYLHGCGYLSKSRVYGGTKYTITDEGRAAITPTPMEKT